MPMQRRQLARSNHGRQGKGPGRQRSAGNLLAFGKEQLDESTNLH